MCLEEANFLPTTERWGMQQERTESLQPGFGDFMYSVSSYLGIRILETLNELLLLQTNQASWASEAWVPTESIRVCGERD